MTGRVLLKIVYLLVARYSTWLSWCSPGDRARDAELLVLRHENAVLRRHVGRVRHEPGDRVAVRAGRPSAVRAGRPGVVRRAGTASTTQSLDRHLSVTPATLLAWHRKLAAKTYDTGNRRKPGRLPTAPGIARLIVRLAKENPLAGIPPGSTAS